MKRNVLIWDGVVRLFHLSFAAGFVVAFIVAINTSKHSSTFQAHMIVGLALVFLVILRLGWSLFGTRWALLRELKLSPNSLLKYFRSILDADVATSPGHNPVTSWTMVLMFGLTFLLGASGLMMTSGNESPEDLHTLAAYSFAVLAGAHLLGITIHTVVKREPIALAMVDGKKIADTSAGLSNASGRASTGFLLLAAMFVGSLFTNWDERAATTQLPLIGTRIALGESEGSTERPENSSESGHSSGHHQDDEDHEDDD